jgi:hypothetical protein
MLAAGAMLLMIGSGGSQTMLLGVYEGDIVLTCTH